MGGFLGFGHSSAKTDRGHTLQGYGDLQNVFNFALPQAKTDIATGRATTKSGLGTVGTGVEDINQSLAYWKQLLSGNLPTMQQAIAPETNAVLAQADAAKRQRSAMGTARGGGTAGAGQQADDKTMATIDNLLFGVRPAAAGAVADIGKAEAGIGLGVAGVGLGERQLGLGAAELAERSGADLASIAAESRRTSIAANQQIQGQIAGGLMAALSMFMGPATPAAAAATGGGASGSVGETFGF